MACLIVVLGLDQIEPLIYLLKENQKAIILPNLININTQTDSTQINILDQIEKYQTINQKEEISDWIFKGKKIVLNEQLESCFFETKDNSQGITSIRIWHLTPQNLEIIKKYRRFSGK